MLLFEDIGYWLGVDMNKQIIHKKYIAYLEAERNAQTEAEGALDAAPQQPQAVDAERDDSKQRETLDGVLHGDEEIVEKRRERNVGRHEDANVNQPRDGQTDAENADDEQEEWPQRIAALQAVRHIENVPLLLELVHGELKLVLRAAGEADLGALSLLAASACENRSYGETKKEIRGRGERQ